MGSLIQVLLAAFSWLIRGSVVKIIIISAIFWLLSYLTPWLLSYLAPWLGVDSLTASFSSIPASVWFFLDFFALDVGIPLIISAYVTRFLIRRIPVIG